MVIPTAFAYIGEMTPLGYEGRYMSTFNVALIAGFGMGPVLGGSVHDALGMDATFISMGILSTLGFLIVFFLLPNKSPSIKAASSQGLKEPEMLSSPFISMLKDRTMQGIITFQIIYGLLLGIVLTFLGIWMISVLETSVAQIGIVLSVRPVMNGILAYPFGWMADRTSRIMLASAGMVMIAIGTFSIPWLGSFALLLYLFMALPLGLIIGSMTGGMIQSSIGIVEVFLYTAVIGFAGIVLFNILMFKSPQIPKRG